MRGWPIYDVTTRFDDFKPHSLSSSLTEVNAGIPSWGKAFFEVPESSQVVSFLFRNAKSCRFTARFIISQFPTMTETAKIIFKFSDAFSGPTDWMIGFVILIHFDNRIVQLIHLSYGTKIAFRLIYSVFLFAPLV